MNKLPYFDDLVEKTLEYNYTTSDGPNNESLGDLLKERQLYFFKNGFGAMVVKFADGLFVTDDFADVNVIEGNMQSWQVVMVSSIAADVRCHSEEDLKDVLERIEKLHEKA